MRAFELLGDDFPHGTVDGFYRGCKGSHCPGAIACRDVYRRYSGDAEFRALIDQGLTARQIVDEELDAAVVREQEQRARELERRRVAAVAREAAKAERRREHAAEHAAERRAEAVASRDSQSGREERPFAAVGFSGEWEDRRVALQRAVIEAQQAVDAAQAVLDAHVASGPTRRPWTNVDDAELLRLYDERLSDTAIGRLMGRHQAVISTKRRGLGLESHGVFGQKAAS